MTKRISRKEKTKVETWEKQMLREDFEGVLKAVTREDFNRLEQVIYGIDWDIGLRKNGFKLERQGAVTTIIPPKRANKTAQAMIDLMKEQRAGVARRLFGSLRATTADQQATRSTEEEVRSTPKPAETSRERV